VSTDRVQYERIHNQIIKTHLRRHVLVPERLHLFGLAVELLELRQIQQGVLPVQRSGSSTSRRQGPPCRRYSSHR
jgi:hypothetical protein